MGRETIAALNAALLAKTNAAKVVRTDKLRADTAVLAANVAYSTDSGLLTRAIDPPPGTAALLRVLLPEMQGGEDPAELVGVGREILPVNDVPQAPHRS